MAIYPILAPNNTWYDGGSSIPKTTYTLIEIKDVYKPSGSITKQWDASSAKNGSIICYAEGTKLTIAGNGTGKIQANPDSALLFGESNAQSKNGFYNVKNINGLSVFDTTQVTSLAGAFQGMGNLLNLDISSWNTSNVKSMAGLCQLDKSLTSVKLSQNFNKNESWAGSFNYCTALTNIQNHEKMVQNRCTNIASTFGKNLITQLDISQWDTSSVKTMSYTFAFCNNLKTIIGCNNLVKKPCENIQYLFYKNSNLTEIDVSNWDTSSVTTFASTFGYCDKLTKIKNAGHIITKTCVNIQGIFQDCANLSELDTTNWDTSSIMNMSFAFYGCTSIKTINTKSWDVSKVSTFDHFAAHSHAKWDTSNWNITTALKNANAMFHACDNEVIDISNCDFSGVEITAQMFDQCPNLKKIVGLDKQKMTNLWSSFEMFNLCPLLEEIKIPYINTQKVKNGGIVSGNGSESLGLQNMFNALPKLKKVQLGKDFNYKGLDATPAVLPTPTVESALDADGNWYDINGNAYTPEQAIMTVPNVYYASKELAQRAKGAKMYLDFNGLKTLVGKIKLLNQKTINKIIGTPEDDISADTIKAVKKEVAGKSPTNHASANTNYGTATESFYGHVKLTNVISGLSTLGTAPTPEAVNKFVENKYDNLIDLIYPIGSIYSTLNPDFNPNGKFKGKWEKIEGRFLLASDSKHKIGTTGGSNTKEIKTKNLPGDTITLVKPGAHKWSTGKWSNADELTQDDFAAVPLNQNQENNGGSGIGYDASLDTTPAYLSVNMWKRTA